MSGYSPHVEDGGHPGLRARKKAATRDALSHAAVALALREGPDNVRVADIAAAAGVSPRTYNNYFSSVPEAICALAADQARRQGDALRDRPATEPLGEAVANAMLTSRPAAPDASGPIAGRDFVRMIITTPALRGEFHQAIMARENSLAEAIAERVGSPPSDLFPRLLAAAYCSAYRVVTRRWLDDQNADYRALLREALDLIAPMAAGYRAVVSAAPDRKG
jgi:AcrR family transcriptional regulator